MLAVPRRVRGEVEPASPARTLPRPARPHPRGGGLGSAAAPRATQECAAPSWALVRANLFMHYAFDTWMTREHPRVQFERYCDDVVVHCETQQQAVRVRDAIAGRLAECGGLQLHPDKTRIVY